MFCPNCGERLDSPNQRFCSRCGSEIQSTITLEFPESPQISTEDTQEAPAAQPVRIYESKSIKVGGPGSYSKRVFVFAFLSLVLAGVGFVLEFLAFFRFVIPIYVFPRLPSLPSLLILAPSLHLIGTVFGIISIVSSSKARKHEVENTLEKVGKVFGILGVIANVIPIVIINIALIFISNPYSLIPGPP